MLASAAARISSNALERWLISSTDIPTPGKAGKPSRICSRTASGSTAGPAPKLKTRSTASSFDWCESPGQMVWISRPSRSFGSNQVDLGGMMPPASETASSSSGVTAASEESDRGGSRVDRLLQGPNAPRPADERHPRIGADVRHVEHRGENPVLEDSHVQPGRRPGAGCRNRGIRHVDGVPGPFQVHRQLALGRDRWAPRP